MRFYLCVSGATIALMIMGCATTVHRPTSTSLEELYADACSPGSKIQLTRGSVWLKAQSKEVSGQFAANVVASKPDQLKLEVTNFLGGTEALISIIDEHYIITGTGAKKEQREEGFGNWGGIPLKWAASLFLGKIPCPSPEEKRKLSLSPEGELLIQVLADSSAARKTKSEPQKFAFKFRSHKGKDWPTSLHWEKLSSPQIAVDFNFDDPEDETLSPKKWEARSERGAVKVKWRDREVTN